MKYTVNAGTGIIILCALIIGMGCEKKEPVLTAEIDPEISFDTSTPIGRKQKDLFEQYGVLFQYKWDRYAFATNVVADPAREEDVLPYMEMMEIVFFGAIDSVAKQLPETGNKMASTKETPVTIFLLGNGLNYGGSESFGESSAGQAGNIQPNRLTLGGLSPFGRLLRVKGPSADAAFLRAIYDAAPNSYPGDAGLIGFIFHEYTHYIDSKNSIPVGFEKPAAPNYLRGTNAYERIPLSTAIQRGFFIPYGMQNESEDFATYVQTMIWKSDDEMRRTYLVNDLTRTKYNLVNKYYTEIGMPILPLRDYLAQPAVKERLIALKRKYE